MRRGSNGVKGFAAVAAAFVLVELAWGPMAVVKVYEEADGVYQDAMFLFYDRQAWFMIEVVKDPDWVRRDRFYRENYRWMLEIRSRGFDWEYDEHGNMIGFEYLPKGMLIPILR